MMEAEARAVMKTHGWTYKIRQPKGVAKYVYAQRREGKEMLDRYICPLSQLGNLTEADLVAKLERPPPAKKI